MVMFRPLQSLTRLCIQNKPFCLLITARGNFSVLVLSFGGSLFHKYCLTKANIPSECVGGGGLPNVLGGSS